VAFRIPVFGPMIKKFGAIPASRENARLVLESGFPLLVCPGGDVDSLKPFSKRHVVDFGERRGFIKLAIERQVPIVPVVSVGAHEVCVILNDGRKMAKALKLDRLLRVKTAPLSFGFPNGLGIAGLGSIPLPSKVTLRVLAPIHLGEPPSAAKDPDRVERAYELVRQTMQVAVDDLSARRRFPVLG
jgi:1-acyl-sn-glycerol-3-phosphate acyltransferase